MSDSRAAIAHDERMEEARRKKFPSMPELTRQAQKVGKEMKKKKRIDNRIGNETHAEAARRIRNQKREERRQEHLKKVRASEVEIAVHRTETFVYRFSTEQIEEMLRAEAYKYLRQHMHKFDSDKLISIEFDCQGDDASALDGAVAQYVKHTHEQDKR